MGTFKLYLDLTKRLCYVTGVPTSDCQGVYHLWYELEVIIVQMIKNTGSSCTRLNGCCAFDLFTFSAGTQAD